jgi:drug/metabolite transporter (DMT)-like permease
MSLNVFLLVLAATVLHASWNYAARKAEGNLRVVWLGLCAACLLALPVILGLRSFRGEIGLLPAASWGFVLATGFLHAVYFLLLAAAYRTGELSVVYPVSRGTGVALTAVLAPLLFAEPVSRWGTAGIAAIIAGVFLLARPSRQGERTVRGLLQAIGVGVIIAAYSLTDKGGVMRVSPVLYIWLMSAICVLTMTPMVLRAVGTGWSEDVRRYGREILIIGFGSMGTYLIILYAFTLGPVGYVVAVREFSVVIGALLGFVFLRESITLRKIAAIALVVTGVALIKLSG